MPLTKNIADYLPYYIGQEVNHPSDRSLFKLVGVNEFGLPIITGDFSGGTHNVEQTGRVCLDEIKLYLRPLSSMTEEEMKELHILFFDPSSREIYTQKIKKIVFYKDEPRRHIKHGTGIGYTTLDENLDHISSGTLSFSRFNANQFHYLLKQGFDLFGLIEANLAVDKTKEEK